VCAKPNVYSARASSYSAFTSLLDQNAEEAAASRGTYRASDFSPEYLYAVASAFGVETSLSRRKMPLLVAIITKAVIQEAASRGITTLGEVTDEKIAERKPKRRPKRRWKSRSSPGSSPHRRKVMQQTTP
jgi:hypothetical protein